jgi:chitodextrinase
MFAKGFVTTPKLSWQENGAQLLWAGFLGVLGLAGIGYFLYKAVRILRPAVYDLHDLGTSLPKFLELVNKDPDKYFPKGIGNFEELKAAYGTARRTVVSATDSRDEADRALRKAKESSPPNAERIKNAEEELEWWEDMVVNTRRSFNAVNTVRMGLLNKAEYWNTSTALDRDGSLMVIAALVAAVGGIGYQLALAAPDKPLDAATTETRAVVVGELIGNDSAPSRALWEELDLSRCQADTSTSRIAVVVASGKGSTVDPYVVSTIPTRTCPSRTFTVIDEVARLSLPVKTEIFYTPAPTPPPSS